MDMKSAYDVSIRVPVTRGERQAVAGIAKTLGLSTRAFARLLFAYAIADVRPLSAYLRKLRAQKLAGGRETKGE